MNLRPEHISHIKQSFEKLSSKEDFLQLLNYAKRLIYGSKSVDISLSQLNYHILPKANRNRYHSFSIPKKMGGERTIHAPNKGLKVLQTCLNLILQCVFQPHKAAYGFVPGKCIADNSALHVGNYYVYNIDIKDFFPSIEQRRVWACLQNPPFNLTEERQQLLIANMIASLCCTEMEVERKNKEEYEKVLRNVLPQGAPTSPLLTNVICQKLDYLLTGVAKRFGLKYSRYADDITFSSLHNVYQKESKFSKELHRIVKEQGFVIKESKTRLQKQGYRQEVTGLLVNEKVNVQKRYVKQLRKWLYLWEKYGYEKAEAIFFTEYVGDRGYAKKGQPGMVNVIAGKLDYLKMIKGENNSGYINLKKHFELNKNGLNKKTNSITVNIDDVDELYTALRDLEFLIVEE